MAFVKWGVEYKPTTVSTQFAVDDVPLKPYAELLMERRRLVTLAHKLLACLDDERDVSLIQEAQSLLARIEGK